jgi:poly(3-hydroxybutyrate) depolymerase
MGACNYDAAGVALQVLYSNQLQPAKPANLANLIKFDQTPYFKSFDSSIEDNGYIYVPDACKAGAVCRLHISFHGCKQTLGDIGNEYAQYSGYSEWAEANNFVVLFPYVKRSLTLPLNPDG